MVIKVNKGGVYIPEYGENKKLPESEQMKVNYRYLLAGERKEYIYTEPMTIDKVKGKVNGDVKYIQNEQGITRAMVEGFENFTLEIGGKEVEIKIIAEMYQNPVPTGLVTEIETAMLLASPEVDKAFLL